MYVFIERFIIRNWLKIMEVGDFQNLQCEATAWTSRIANVADEDWRQSAGEFLLA